LTILVVTLGALGLAFFLYTQTRKEGGNSIQFLAQGKEAGFSNKEAEILRKIAAQNNIGNTSLIFHSQEHFDNCIRVFLRSMKMSGETEDAEMQNFLSKLYDYRKVIEMNKPKNRIGISSSRQIGEGQFLRILVEGIGVFSSQVIRNTSQVMIISRPVNTKIISPVSWTGMKIAVYFWKEDDAGYVFDSVVEDEVYSKGVSSIKITHSDSLFRTQKRKSIRIKMNKLVYLYPVFDEDHPHQLETEAGVKGYLEDVSDTGCAVMVGGKADSGLRLKVQFALNGQPLCISGTVRVVAYREDSNRTLLRIEADPLPVLTRNLILGEVFRTQDDFDDDLPFRELDEEAANLSANGIRNTLEVMLDNNSLRDVSMPEVSMPDLSAPGFGSEGIFKNTK